MFSTSNMGILEEPADQVLDLRTRSFFPLHQRLINVGPAVLNVLKVALVFENANGSQNAVIGCWGTRFPVTRTSLSVAGQLHRTGVFSLLRRWDDPCINRTQSCSASPRPSTRRGDRSSHSSAPRGHSKHLYSAWFSGGSIAPSAVFGSLVAAIAAFRRARSDGAGAFSSHRPDTRRHRAREARSIADGSPQGTARDHRNQSRVRLPPVARSVSTKV